ncbi:hypothetical protein AVEN_156376-1 [Araneus ventricosus]|uniref:Uncharacterized protein n=1 Tax=Araneus ventricosus TaxID=182803 RepID=A0A4Y2VQL2_ARAVE|nr:hypothetical protein AVEN_156376-1 [Araneus ventricosus]
MERGECPSARHSKGRPAIQIRLQIIRNSKHPIHLRHLSSVSHTDERFSLPAFQKSRKWRAVNALQLGPQKAIRTFQSDFKQFGIPNIQSSGGSSICAHEHVNPQ